MENAPCIAFGHVIRYPWDVVRVPRIQTWPLDSSDANLAEAGEGRMLQSFIYLVPSQEENLVIVASGDFEPHLIDLCRVYLR
jgi:hypothetical protein